MAGYTELLAAGTTAATADFKVSAGYISQIVGFGFVSSADQIAILTSYDGGTTYVSSYDGNGVEVAVAGSGGANPRNPVNVMGPGFYRLSRASGGTDSIGAALIQTVIG
jgi:hypothetical protein